MIRIQISILYYSYRPHNIFGLPHWLTLKTKLMSSHFQLAFRCLSLMITLRLESFSV